MYMARIIGQIPPQGPAVKLDRSVPCVECGGLVSINEGEDDATVGHHSGDPP